MTANRLKTMGPTGTAVAETGRGGTPAGQPPVDQAVIEQLAGITDSAGLSVLGELLNAFLGAAPVRLDALDRAVAAGDLPAVADQAHALTGSSASFGARGMAALCRQLRVEAERGDVEAARSLLRDLDAEFVRVRASLVSLTSRKA